MHLVHMQVGCSTPPMAALRTSRAVPLLVCIQVRDAMRTSAGSEVCPVSAAVLDAKECSRGAPRLHWDVSAWKATTDS